MLYLLPQLEQEPCHWHESKQDDCPPAKFSCDKDAPFEIARQAENGPAAPVNGHSRLLKERKLKLRISAVGFLGALVLMLVVTPFVRGFKAGPLYEALLFTLVMCTGLIASGSRRRLALALASFALAAIWLNQLWPKECPALTFILPGMAFLAVVIASLLGFVLRARQVDANVLCAGISVYLMIGLIWGLAYTFVAEINPNAFSYNPPATATPMSGFTAIYFSFMTLMTVGYGDITPVADVARMLAMLEAITGTLFVYVLIARLVSHYSAPRPSQTPAHNEGQRSYN